VTYIPTAQDLDWTKRVIQGKHSWAVPSGGCILTLNHDQMKFATFIKTNPNPQEIDLFDRIFLNMIALGYQEEKRIICEGANSTDDIARNVFEWTNDEIELSKINSLRNRPTDPRFNMNEDWEPSSISIEWTRNHISSLGEGALWVIPDASAIMKISHTQKNYTLIVGQNQADNETIYMNKTTKIMEIIGYKLAGLFVDDADISVFERLKNVEEWALD
jgi:hypothetical protein